MRASNTRVAATFFFTSLSLSHIKHLCHHGWGPSRRYRFPLLPTLTGIPLLETKQFHLDSIKGAPNPDGLDYSPIQVENEALVEQKLKPSKIDKKRSFIAHIRWMLSTFEDGRISISPYDTAWLALIKNIDGSHTPQFPSSLKWISQNQLSDGSWGDERDFSIYDRLLNTLACVIALRSWKVHSNQSQRGIRFMKEASTKLERANVDSLTCGFEILFPPLLEIARNLGIEISYDTQFLTEIFAFRDKKLTRIPMEYMHEVATPILYNLEGIEGLNWEKILKLQTEEGSLLTSPSATAFAFIQTADNNCFKYLNHIVTKFDGGAPTVYPIDLFARLWAVDRLQRLGISYLFEEQIVECLDYVHRYWTENGVFSGRKATICDLDDTSMGFRLLRLKGYNVSPDVFEHFKSEGKFICLGGELNASPTTLLNLYKASQVRFPGENVLEDAKNFSYNFLKDKILSNEIVDKWVRSKDIPGELKFGIEIPWYACLPRIEARFYIEQYSGADDVWIGKTFYRVEEISNNHYLEVAKLDFNECQIQHQLEWTNMLQWWKKFKLGEYGLRREELLRNYFVAAASIFEQGRSTERYGWAKSWTIIQILGIYFHRVATSRQKRSSFLEAFKGDANGGNVSLHKIDEMGKSLLRIIQEFIYQLSIDTFQILHRDIRQQLTTMWEKWLMESIDIESGRFRNEGAFLAHIINLCAGNTRVEEEELKYLSHLTNKVCFLLGEYEENRSINCSITDIEIDMQQLLKLVVQMKPPPSSSSGSPIPQNAKQTFLTVAKAFYYTSCCHKQTISFHISKVLFEPLL